MTYFRIKALSTYYYLHVHYFNVETGLTAPYVLSAGWLLNFPWAINKVLSLSVIYDHNLAEENNNGLQIVVK